ncbi:hypothetical protein ElyMa_000424600 [Elysia marginata]|uniref:Uncharacterized protein n=1 Tax=Elysia marginata TaxID=1093978 RepID=A0AAV4FPN1_9GAST|nr:hypothetical protein ElyMa_000424600 [Elysia marginata]
MLVGVVSMLDSRSGGRGFDSRPYHVAVALEKQFTLTFPSPPTCKIKIKNGGIILALARWRDRRMEGNDNPFLMPAGQSQDKAKMGRLPSYRLQLQVLVCWGISGATVW